VAGPLDSAGAAPYVGPGARLLGDVRLAPNSSVFSNAVLRGEADFVEIGPGANVQDNCVVEGLVSHPARIGARVTLGHNARVYGATIDADAMVAIGATVLPGAHVGRHTIVAANATVPAGMHVPDGKLVIGQGRILRDVTEAEIARIERGGIEYVRLSREYLASAISETA